MLVEEKNKNQTITATVTDQYIFKINKQLTDFNSIMVMQEMEKVQQEVKSVMEGAIVDSSKLSLNFTV